jgi:transcription elongation factor Elf1
MFPIFCAICDSEEQSLLGLEDHIYRAHWNNPGKVQAKNKVSTKPTTTKRLFRCEHCSLVLQSNWLLQRHVVTAHSAKNRIQCHLCRKSFQSRVGLTQHMRLSHKKKEEVVQVRQSDDDDEVHEVSTDFATVDDDVCTQTGTKPGKGNPILAKGRNASFQSSSPNTTSSFSGDDKSPKIVKVTSSMHLMKRAKAIGKSVTITRSESPRGKSSSAPQNAIKLSNLGRNLVVNSGVRVNAFNLNKTYQKKTPESLNLQQKKAANFFISCTKCGIPFKNAAYLVAHIKSVHFSLF